jgi:hypothetical protein
MNKKFIIAYLRELGAIAQNFYSTRKSEKKRIGNESALLHVYRKLDPEFIKKIIRNVVNRKLNRVENTECLGMVNPDFFTKIDF